MMHKQPHKDTTNPPGQIRYPSHLEMPLKRAVEAFRDEEMRGLVMRVQQLESELRYLRQHTLALYAELESSKKNFSNF